MSGTPRTRSQPNALSFKIGRWAEATASGWGLVALVILAGLLAVVLLLGGSGLLPH